MGKKISKKSHGDRAILRRPYEHRANSDRTVAVTHSRSICDRCITPERIEFCDRT